MVAKLMMEQLQKAGIDPALLASQFKEAMDKFSDMDERLKRIEYYITADSLIRANPPKDAQ